MWKSSFPNEVKSVSWCPSEYTVDVHVDVVHVDVVHVHVDVVHVDVVHVVDVQVKSNGIKSNQIKPNGMTKSNQKIELAIQLNK